MLAGLKLKSVLSTNNKLYQSTQEPETNWGKKIWAEHIHPIYSAQGEDSVQHIIWNCESSKHIWDWLQQIFNFRTSINFEDAINQSKTRSAAIQQAWESSAVIAMAEIWHIRNRCLHEDIRANKNEMLQRIKNKIEQNSMLITGDMNNSVADLCTLKAIGAGSMQVKHHTAIPCYWSPPARDFIAICCDGGSRGNPGNSGAGVCIRDSNSNVIATIAAGLGRGTNYLAEIMAIIIGIEWAVYNGYTKLVIYSDSKAAIQAFEKAKLPWYAISRWNAAKSRVQDTGFKHVFRKINIAADALSKKGTHIDKDEIIITHGKPEDLTVEIPFQVYYIFKT